MEENSKLKKSNPLEKVCAFIVDKRNLFFLIFGIAMVFSVFSRNWVKVENALSAFLPEGYETAEALDIMDDQFITYGTCDVMIANITYKDAEDLSKEIEKMDGISMITFDDTKKHYNNASALYNITFDYSEKDDKCLEALDNLKAKLNGYDMYISTSLGDTISKTIADEMSVIIVIVAFVVVGVLLLTSQSFAEVPVLLLTFVSAALINMGTNFMLGTISFVSNSVTVVLQLALSLDYAIILCNRYKEEHLSLPPREAIIAALSKAIPEISASSLTTVGGLAALLFMKFKIGPDMGIALIKSVALSLLSVFLLMPGLIMLFSNLMEKTKHKNFVPKIPFVGKIAYRTRHIVPPIFLVVIIAGFFISKQCPYVYGYSSLKTPKLNSTQIAQNIIRDTFGESNMLALMVPTGNYDKEKALMNDLEKDKEVNSTMGLSNIDAMDGYMLTDKLGPREFGELTNLDYEVAKVIYGAYAADDKNYAKIVSGVADYKVPLIDMFMFVYKQVEAGYVKLDDEQMESLTSAYSQMNIAKQQLKGDKYSRMLVYLDLPEDGNETFAYLDKIHKTAAKYYDSGVYLAGNSVCDYDLCKTFGGDNVIVSLVSILVVLVVLLFTFKSVGMPILLIMVIQGVIWINFSIPTLRHSNLFFMSYLIVSSIQMGANIDYAIVISSRYMDTKKRMSRKEAIIDSMNFAFPTIITSGATLTIAAVLIGQMTSEATIAGIGQCLGRGTMISIFIVMFGLPQILLLGDRVIEKTAFTVPSPIQERNGSGEIRLDGLVKGEINGRISAVVHGTVTGDVNVNIISSSIKDNKQDIGGNGNETVQE